MVGYFTVDSSEIEKGNQLRGRGVVGKSNVTIVTKSTPLELITTGKVTRRCRYFKAKVLESYTVDNLAPTLQESIEDKSIVFTDKSTSYVNIANYVNLHITKKINS